MKKILTISITVLTLASCANDSTLIEGSDLNEIKYAVTTNNISRNAPEYTSSNLPDHFYVFASMNGDPDVHYINNDKVTGTEGSDGTTTYTADITRYWPGYGLYFIAWTGAQKKDGSNYAEVTKWTSIGSLSGFPKAEFKVDLPEKDDDQNDFIYATKNTLNQSVNLTFKHAYAALNFNIINNIKTLYIEVEKITVKNIRNTDALVYVSQTNGSSVIDWDGYTSDISKRTGNEYIELDNAKAFRCPLNVSELASNPDYKFGDNLYVFQHDKATGKTDADYAYSSANTTGAYIELSCRVYSLSSTSANLIESDYLGFNYYPFQGAEVESLVFGSDTGGFKNIRIPITPDWQSGYKYTYNITFTDTDNTDGVGEDESGNPIKFSKISLDASVGSFDDTTSSDHTIKPS